MPQKISIISHIQWCISGKCSMISDSWKSEFFWKILLKHTFTQYSRGIWSLSDLLTLDKFLFHIQKTHSEKMCIFHRWGMKIQLCWPFLQKGTYTKWNCQFWMGIALHISWTTNSTCHKDISNCRRKGNEISENAGKIFWELFTYPFVYSITRQTD